MAALMEAQRFQAILESLPNGIYVVDTDRRILFWNDGAERITGYTRQEVIGRRCRDDLLMHCDESLNGLCETGCPLLETMWDGKPRDGNLLLRHKDGHRVPVRVRALPVRSDTGAIIGAVESFDERCVSPDTWPHPHQEAVQNHIDGATGVSDRPSVLSYLEACLCDFAEDQVPFSVLNIHVNGQAELRQTHSLEAAQKMLQLVAATLARNLPEKDVVGHWAEDRFLAILRDCPWCALESVVEGLEGIVRGIELPWWGDRLRVAITAGGTPVRPGDTIDSLLERSERALASARDAGKSTSVI